MSWVEKAGGAAASAGGGLYLTALGIRGFDGEVVPWVNEPLYFAAAGCILAAVVLFVVPIVRRTRVRGDALQHEREQPNQIIGAKIWGNGEAGVRVEGGRGLYLRDAIITENGGDGVDATDATGSIVIDGGEISRNKGAGVSWKKPPRHPSHDE